MNYRSKKIAIAVLAALLITSMPTIATEITGITGNNGVYNINPTSKRLDTGFRQYQNFNLSQGDIANLIFSVNGQDVSKFVNLVDNKININGLVNAINANGQLNNGHAIFVSPNGMVVGSSGVLRVGSLSVYSPTLSKYNSYKANPDLAFNKLDQNNADITVNGKIIARENVLLSGKNLNIGTNSAIFTGVNSAVANSDSVFNQLVNSSVKASNAFASQNGKIYLKSSSASGASNINGDLRNFAQNGDINVNSKSMGGLNMSGNVASADKINLTNQRGNMVLNADIDGKNFTRITNKGISLKFDGNITNDNQLRVWNNGTSGTKLTGTINNNGTAVIQNDNGVTIMDGVVNNNQNGYMNVNSKGSQLNITNDSTISNDGRLRIWNTGANGTTVDGSLGNSGRMVIQNYNGDMNITGSAINTGNLNVINSGNKLTLNTDSALLNAGYAGILNEGQGGFEFKGEADNANRLIMTNKGGNMTVSGDVDNYANANITNKSGKLTVSSSSNINNDKVMKIWNTGSNGSEFNGEINNNTNVSVMVLQNDGGDMTIKNSVNNNGVNGGTISVKNNSGELNITQSAELNNNGRVILTNNGNDGLRFEGLISNDSQSGTKSVKIDNNSGELHFGGQIASNADTDVYIESNGNLAFEGDITNYGNLTMYHTGAGNFDLDGDITNTGKTLLTNRTGNMNINGNVTTVGEKLNITNRGNKLTFNTNSEVNNNGTLKIWSTGANGTEVKGQIINSDGNLALENDLGSLNVTSTGRIINLGNNAKIQLTNKGSQGLTTAQGSIIASEGDIDIQNITNLTPASINGIVYSQNGRILAKNVDPETEATTNISIPEFEMPSGGILPQ